MNETVIKSDQRREYGQILVRHRGRILLLKRRGREDWQLPGALSRRVGEAPINAAARGLWDQTGLRLPLRDLLCVDHHPGRTFFVFDGGGIGPALADRAMESATEPYSEADFVEPQVLSLHMSLGETRRIREALLAADMKRGILTLCFGSPSHR